MKFNYFLCMQCGVIVNENNGYRHIGHDILGEMFVIKKIPKKPTFGLISRTLVNREREKQNLIKYEKKELLRKKKKLLQQKRYALQIPNNALIINLEILE